MYLLYLIARLFLLSKSQDQTRSLPPPSFILLLGSPPICLSWSKVIKPLIFKTHVSSVKHDVACFTDEVHYSQSDDYAWLVFYLESFTKMQIVLQEVEEGIPARERA